MKKNTKKLIASCTLCAMLLSGASLVNAAEITEKEVTRKIVDSSVAVPYSSL